MNNIKKSNFNDYFEDVMGKDPKEPQSNEQEVSHYHPGSQEEGRQTKEG